LKNTGKTLPLDDYWFVKEEMTRGNQREIDRQRAANRNATAGAPKDGDHNARKVIPIGFICAIYFLNCNVL